MPEKMSFEDMPKWSTLLENLDEDVSDRQKSDQLKNKKLEEFVYSPYRRREARFWLTIRGKIFYKKIVDRHKNNNLIHRLDKCIDNWDEVIFNILEKIQQEDRYNLWVNSTLERDGSKCYSDYCRCSYKENVYVDYMKTISEQIAEYFFTEPINLTDFDYNLLPDLYDENNAITLCYQCFDYIVRKEKELEINYSDKAMEVCKEYMKCLTDKNKDLAKKEKIYQELYEFFSDERKNFDKRSKIINEIIEHLKLKTVDNELLLSKLEQLHVLQEKLEDDSGNCQLEIEVLFRLKRFKEAKRLALNQEKYRMFKKNISKKLKLKTIQQTFASRHRIQILDRMIDKLIKRYRLNDFTIKYMTPESYDAEDIEILFRESEEEIRKEMGVPAIGEGWVTETELYYLVKYLLREYDVIFHYRAEWLGRQEFDIYISELKLAIEYMGEQHYRPIAYFGGEKKFQRIKELDSKKKRKAEQNGVTIIYIKYDDDINEASVIKKINSYL